MRFATVLERKLSEAALDLIKAGLDNFEKVQVCSP